MDFLAMLSAEEERIKGEVAWFHIYKQTQKKSIIPLQHTDRLTTSGHCTCRADVWERVRHAQADGNAHKEHTACGVNTCFLMSCIFRHFQFLCSPFTECAVRWLAATWNWTAAASKVQERARLHLYGACPLRPLRAWLLTLVSTVSTHTLTRLFVFIQVHLLNHNQAHRSSSQCIYRSTGSNMWLYRK